MTDGQLIGDPSGAAEHWFEQAANGFCVPASITQMVAEYTGLEFDDESFFVERANDLKLFDVSPKGVPSMTVEGAATLLVDTGIDAHVEKDLTILDLENFLDEGRPVMLAVDADEMWYGEADSVDDAPNHAVVLTGIDPVNGVAIISDPGSPDGNESTMPIAELDRMWADSDRQAVVIDVGEGTSSSAPAPDESPVEDGGSQAPVADPVAFDADASGGATDATDATLAEISPALPEADSSAMERTVAWLMHHPYVVIPVVVVAGARTRKKP